MHGTPRYPITADAQSYGAVSYLAYRGIGEDAFNVCLVCHETAENHREHAENKKERLYLWCAGKDIDEPDNHIESYHFYEEAGKDCGYRCRRHECASAPGGTGQAPL